MSPDYSHYYPALQRKGPSTNGRLPDRPTPELETDSPTACGLLMWVSVSVSVITLINGSVRKEYSFPLN